MSIAAMTPWLMEEARDTSNSSQKMKYARKRRVCRESDALGRGIETFSAGHNGIKTETRPV